VRGGRDSSKPHVFFRDGHWMAYLPGAGWEQGAIVPLLGSTITEHRRAAGFMR
jgi:hypothetical protein